MANEQRKPVIGLSVGLLDFGNYAAVGHQRPVARAGGIPLVLPWLDGGRLGETLDACDGILLGGGRDIEPARYGQEPHELLSVTDPQRDAFELELVAQALDRGLPILGMCRGIQILNIALGGTLVQDVSLRPGPEHPTDRGWKRWKEVERASLEDDPVVPDHPRHPISVEPGTRLHAALGVEEIEVDSFHHQTLDAVAGDLNVVATSPDGVVEAVELGGEAYVLAVQWEQQEEWRVDRRFLAPFEHFVAAAARRRLETVH
jgi:putative glutamine amidotransferase